MRILTFAAATALLAGCAGSPTEPLGTAIDAPAPPPGVPGDCPLRIDFASYGAGIDRAAREKVEALLRGDRAVTGVEPFGWGREGEVTLCVRVRRADAAERLLRQVKALIPANPRGPVSGYTRAGSRFEISQTR